MSNEWHEWDGHYEKQFYDVMEPDGNIIIHCWPNAGMMCPVHTDKANIPPNPKYKVRVSPTHPCDNL